MLEQISLRPHPYPSFAVMNAKHGAFARHSPTQNRLLAALPVANYESVLPHLERVQLTPGQTVHEAGNREQYLYFPTAGIVSRFYVMENGASAEIAVTGSEGVIGIELFMGGDNTTSRAVVQSAGDAYRLGAHALKREFEHNGPLRNMLLRYTQALMSQMAQTAACNRHHAVEQQLARWLLLSLDRLPSNEFTMTQELIANNLGVRRESVTEAAGKLQAAGLLHYSRGHITVLDRLKLEARACECYAVVKSEYDRLLPDLSAKRNHLKGSAQQWGKLTDDQLDVTAGMGDRLIAKIKVA
jgi:CRP-like cAMP-binding protein